MEEQFNVFIIQAVIQFFGEQEPMDFVLKNLWEAGLVALESSSKFTTGQPGQVPGPLGELPVAGVSVTL